MAEGVNKQKVKDYLDFGNKELAKEMKEKIESPEEWREFKRGLANLIAKFSSSPVPENRKKLDDFVATNYLTHKMFGKDALEQILLDLGVRTDVVPARPGKKESSKNNGSEYRREIYHKLGMEAPEDIIARREKEIDEKEDIKYGIQRKTTRKVGKTKSVEPEDIEDNPEKEPKEDGKIKKKIKKAYYKLTASMLIAPGEVPPEVLQENRDIISNTSNKLSELMDNFEKARQVIHKELSSNIDKIPSNIISSSDIIRSYDLMIEGKMTEEELEAFESTLEEKKSEKLNEIRNAIDGLQRSKLEQQLREFAKSNFPDMSEGEIDQEVEYVLADSKVDKEGKLVLPSRSILKEALFDKEDRADVKSVDLIGKITVYASIPKAKDLSDRELLRVARNYKHPKYMSSKSKEFAVASFLHEHPEMLIDGSDKLMQTMREAQEEYMVVKNISEEAELVHKIMISKEIDGQFQELQSMVRSYDESEVENGEIDEDKSKKRQVALKIARKKVESLEKAGLNTVIFSGEEKGRSIIRKAKDVLLPKLDKARKTGNRAFEELKKSEEPEQPEHAE